MSYADDLESAWARVMARGGTGNAIPNDLQLMGEAVSKIAETEMPLTIEVVKTACPSLSDIETKEKAISTTLSTAFTLGVQVGIELREPSS